MNTSTDTSRPDTAETPNPERPLREWLVTWKGGASEVVAGHYWHEHHQTGALTLYRVDKIDGLNTSLIVLLANPAMVHSIRETLPFDPQADSAAVTGAEA